MEIAPISGNRALPAERSSQGNFGAPEVLDIEGSVRPGDGERHGGGGKASGSEENEEDDVMLEAETEPDETSGEDSAHSVDYFA
jgi:hypothetical protein